LQIFCIRLVWKALSVVIITKICIGSALCAVCVHNVCSTVCIIKKFIIAYSRNCITFGRSLRYAIIRARLYFAVLRCIHKIAVFTIQRSIKEIKSNFPGCCVRFDSESIRFLEFESFRFDSENFDLHYKCFTCLPSASVEAVHPA